MSEPGRRALRHAVTFALVAAAAVATSTSAQSLVAQAGNGSPQAPTPPATPAPTAGQPTFRTGINFVRVDAIVTDRQGRPISDLKATDFEVTEDGKPQTIESFRSVRVDGAAPVETTSPVRTRADEERVAADENARIFVFFLDDYHVRLGNSMAARKPLAEFVQNSLAPGDLVAVMYPLSPLDTVSLTRDHQSVIRALERFEGRKFNYEPRNATEQRYALYPAETVERIRRQVSLSAIEGLAVKLGALREGRKAVIVVSEGYTALLPPQLRDPVASMPGMGNPSRRNPSAGQNSIVEDRAEMIGELDLQQEMQEVFGAANRNNTALYTVDPRGLATGEFDINENVGVQRSNTSLRQTQDTLRVLAEETDGRAIVNRNDFGRAMQQIVADSSAYYLIGYSSTQAPQDGKFHEIKVRVRRPGADVRARKGYWALTAAETARVNAPPKPALPSGVSRALSSIAEPSRGRLIRTWVGTSRGENGKTRVTFVWEPIAAQPGVRRESAASVSLMAASPDGAMHYQGTVPDAAAATVRQVSFDVPPGRLQLRIGVNGSAGGAIDNDDREVVVPDLTSTDLALGTPHVFVARTAREVQAIRSGAGSVVPSANREFRRTDRLVVRVDAYRPGSSAAVMSARLLNRQGASLAEIPITALSQGDSYIIDLPLAALAPSEYLLEVKVAGDGQPGATELVAFRVEG